MAALNKLPDVTVEAKLPPNETPQELPPDETPQELPQEIIAAHDVSRPDLVRFDPYTGDVSEIATLIVGGLLFEDWETVWIQWNWNDPHARFRFTCAEREPYPESALILQFKPGDYCQIFLGGILVIAGVIITRQVAYDDKSHGVVLEGVSLSWYAQRSGIDHKTHDFSNKSFTQIAAEILAPTGVGYQTVGKIDETPFKSGATPGTGETIFQFLERLARDRKIIVSSTPTGDMLFIGEHNWPLVGDLIEGINIKKMQCVITLDSAYSEYVTTAQKIADDNSHGREASEQEARVKGMLQRYSKLITALEHPVASLAEVVTRNDTEKMWSEDLYSIQANVTVYGWFRPRPSVVPSLGYATPMQVNHILWQAGDEVWVNSPMAMLNGYRLKIRTVTWTQDNQGGTQSLLQLTTPRGLNSKTPIPIQSASIAQSKPSTGPAETPPIFSPPP